MNNLSEKNNQKILVVDDEIYVDLMRSVLRRLEIDGFKTIVVEPKGKMGTGDE